MKNIKNYSISLIATAIILCSISNCCISAEEYSDNNTKTTYSLEKVELDKTPAMADYIAASRKKIKNNWYPPTASFENTATIVVTVDKNGNLIDCAIANSSNDDGFDNSLIKAVKKTKFSPLPSEIKGDSVNIDFTFNMQKRNLKNNK